MKKLSGNGVIMGILSNLEPAAVFHYFEEICSIPHGSTNTKAISDYCVQFAKEHELKYIQDDMNNVIILKPGTTGYEDSAPVMLQGHLDMVCEKEADCEIDFQKDGLTLQLENNIISAKGTTLGGDDGIAIAYTLAILSSKDIPHPPIEAVFTVDEEIGMLGAAAIDCSPLKSRIMFNIDSEEEGHLLVSCAGGISTTGHLPIQKEEKEGFKVTLSISGLLGGHSGVEIDKGRANACQLLGRTLYELTQNVSFQLASVQGGLKDNAIPRDATAELLVNNEADLKTLTDITKQLNVIYKKEYQTTDSNITVVTKTDTFTSTMMVITSDISEKIITALFNLPCGIQRMSQDIEGLVQTSLNLGILKTADSEVTFSFAVRSSVESEKQELVKRIKCLMEALGGTVSSHGEYPAWEYRKKSMLRDMMVNVYEEQYGKKPIIEAIHAGLECGLFCGKIPELDCVSFGPDMKDIHTPNESMDVNSVLRTWNYILEILKQLK